MTSDAESLRRQTPEEALARAKREDSKRGRLKIFLGFAAGVGKTYEMLSEANRRKCQRGQDVVIGFLETHGRKGTEEQIGELEVVSRRKIEYRGAVFDEMDTDAIIARKPYLVLVDELAHTNVPGCRHEKRWQDVEVILDAGINVATTMNVQHMESLNDTIHEITGVWVRETVPDRVVKEADEVKMVDITPRSLIHRLERGDIYKPDKVAQALNNFFREGNLSALREIALREIAQEVDEDVNAYRKERHISDQWATHDRIMVCITPDKSSLRLIRRGWRMAHRLHGDIVAVYVEDHTPDASEQEILKNDFALSDRLKISTVTLHGDVATEIIRYARENRMTQIIVGHSNRSRWHELMHGSIIYRLTQELRSIDILIVAAGDEKPEEKH